MPSKINADEIFEKRLKSCVDELRWLYMEIYSNGSMFAELCEQIHAFYLSRSASLRRKDLRREKDPGWYKKNDLLGMMFYIENFGGDMKGVEKRLDYIEKCNVNYVHLMPFLDTVPGRSDGGYAVSDFRRVRPDLGTMTDLEHLAKACHKRGINV